MARQRRKRLKVVEITFAPDGDEQGKANLAEALKILLSRNGGSDVGGDDIIDVNVDKKTAQNEEAVD